MSDENLFIGDKVFVGGSFDEYAQQRTVPLPDAHPSQWQAFVDYQLTQPQSSEARQRLVIMRDVLKRYTLTAAQFAEWWSISASN